MRFVSQYARFQNWDEDYITTQEVVSSKMNDSAGMVATDSTSPFSGGNVDLTSTDEPAPF
jgi:hypothetical protein